MKTTTLNRWLKPLAIFLVIVLLVMLLIPSELTDEQLAQIKPGMTILDVQRLLGQRNGRGFIAASTPGLFWKQDQKWWKPALQAKIEGEAIATGCFIWQNGTLLLSVEHRDGIVTRTWLFPITRSGGGLQGCIDTFKEYWEKWWR
ncbi:MAG TPA: hypothetical protein PLN21_09825 [Gemmatales bacterium]|nr:hypothetical protein [Gemmatales bacterium]